MVQKKRLTEETVTHIIVHATMTSPQTDMRLAEFQRRRRKEGYIDAGFHYFIERSGEFETPIPVEEAGAHTSRYNDRSVGIVLVGGNNPKGTGPEANFTLEQYNTLAVISNSLLLRFPNAEIVGLRDLRSGTQVNPSFNVQELLRRLNFPT